MNVRRVRLAERAALLGALGLVAALFADWFAVSPGSRAGWKAYAPLTARTTGWDSLGWLTLALLVICIVSAVALVAALVVSGLDAFHTPPGVALVAVGVPALMVLLFVMLARPGLGLDLPNDLVTVEPAGWIGLSCAVLMVAGGIASLHDQRLGGPGRRAGPAPARPAP